jgi:hypothetical protein
MNGVISLRNRHGGSSQSFVAQSTMYRTICLASGSGPSQSRAEYGSDAEAWSHLIESSQRQLAAGWTRTDVGEKSAIPVKLEAPVYIGPTMTLAHTLFITVKRPIEESMLEAAAVETLRVCERCPVLLPRVRFEGNAVIFTNEPRNYVIGICDQWETLEEEVRERILLGGQPYKGRRIPPMRAWTEVRQHPVWSLPTGGSKLDVVYRVFFALLGKRTELEITDLFGNRTEPNNPLAFEIEHYSAPWLRQGLIPEFLAREGFGPGHFLPKLHVVPEFSMF